MKNMRRPILITLTLTTLLIASCSNEEKNKVIANEQQLTQTYFELYTYENDEKTSDFHYDENSRDEIRDLSRCLSKKTYKKLSNDALILITEVQTIEDMNIEEWDELEDKFSNNELSKDWEVIRKAKYGTGTYDCSDDKYKPKKETTTSQEDLQQTFYRTEYEENMNTENYVADSEIEKISEYATCISDKTYNDLSKDALHQLKEPSDSFDPLFTSWKDLENQLNDQGLSDDWEIISDYTESYSSSCS